MKNLFNEDYYEKGVELGISCYSNYRWMPELTIPLAHRMVVYLGINYYDKILDFGCAKGYLVKAFNLLGYSSCGYDISLYAISKAPIDICSDLTCDLNALKYKNINWTISKDVLEHIDYADIDVSIQKIREISEKVFVVVPLGDNGKYNISTYDMDITHVIKEPLEWWEKKFKENGLEVVYSGYKVKGIKENWSKYENGNGFFILKRRYI